MKKTVLYFHRKTEPLVEKTARILALEINQLGFQALETQSTQPLRLLTDQPHLLHMFIQKWPLRPTELIFLTLAKMLQIPVILSLFDDQKKVFKTFKSWTPDALTVCQSNELSKYRDWSCSKALLPLIPFSTVKGKSKVESETKAKRESFFVILHESFKELESLQLKSTVYFDARKLLASSDAKTLRKKWSQLITEKKHFSRYIMLTCEDSIEDLLQTESSVIVLADPKISHVELTTWIEKTMNRQHLILLNSLQATGFSQTWTSGQNGLVCDPMNWKSELQKIEKADFYPTLQTYIKPNEALVPLTNEISRLYTKIIHQKTSLLSMPSATI